MHKPSMPSQEQRKIYPIHTFGMLAHKTDPQAA